MKYNPSQKKFKLTDLRHMSADLNQFTLVRKAGKISPSLSVQKWFEEAGTGGRVDQQDLKNILNIFYRSPRGTLFCESQNHEDARRWSALVPLVLATFKEYRDIEYSEWDWHDPVMDKFLDADLRSLLPYIRGTVEVEQFDTASLVEMLKDTATTRTGKTAGVVIAPEKITSVTKVPRLSAYPRLLKIIILQVWVSHPSLRNKYMILDVLDVDNLPEPITSTDIFKTEWPARVTTDSANDLPW